MDVRLPDGTVIRNVPDGTTKADLTAKLKSNGYDVSSWESATPASSPASASASAPASAPAPMNVDPSEGMSPLEKLAVGAGAAVARVGRGIGHLIPAWKDDPRLAEADDNARLYEKYHPGGWATAGEVAGDVAMSALPLGAVTKGVQAARALALPLATARYAPLAADVASNAAYSAATSPDDRGTAALVGAAGAAGGRVLNRALSGLVKPTDEAQAMLDRGIRLTPGQAGDGVMGQLADTYERGLQAVPGVGSVVTGARDQALGDWNRSLVSAGPINTAAPVGRVAVGEAVQRAGNQYKSIFPEGATLTFSDDMSRVYDDKVAALASKVAPSALPKFRSIAEWIGQQAKDGISAPQWKEVVDGELGSAMNAAKRDGQYSLFTALRSLGDHLTNALPDMGGPTPVQLRAADKGYSYAKTLEDASSKAGPVKRGGVMYPSDVAAAAAKKGNEPLLRQALNAQAVLGNTPTPMDKLGNVIRAGAVGAVGHAVAGGVALPVAAISLLGAHPVGRLVLMGQYPIQRFLAEYPNVAAQVGRAMAQSQVPQAVPEQ